MAFNTRQSDRFSMGTADNTIKDIWQVCLLSNLSRLGSVTLTLSLWVWDMLLEFTQRKEGHSLPNSAWAEVECNGSLSKIGERNI